MSYIPTNLTAIDQESIVEWARKEFDEIQKAFTVQDFLRLKEWHSEPKKTFLGMIVLADGTDWNPASGGQGVYCFYGAAWHKLG